MARLVISQKKKGKFNLALPHYILINGKNIGLINTFTVTLEVQAYEVPGIFSLMEPMPGALEAVERIAKKYDVFILSTAPWGNPSAWSDKFLWVKKHFGEVFYKRLILTHRKDLVKGNTSLTTEVRTGQTSSRENGFSSEVTDFPTGHLS